MKVDHSRNLVIKTIALGILIYLALPTVGRVPASDRWVIALVAAIVGYLIGDLVLLPRWGTTWTAVADIVLIALSVLATASLLTTSTISTGGAIIIGVLGGVIEWFFHIFLKQVPPNRTDDRNNS